MDKNKKGYRVNLPPRLEECTLDNFQESNEGEKNAMDQAKKFMDRFPYVGCLTLVGNMGTGKTHLAVGICQKLAKDNFSCRYITMRQMAREVRATWRTGAKETEQQIIDMFCQRYDLLVIDEIGIQGAKEDGLKILLSEIIDGRMLWDNPTILVGNVKTKDDALVAMGSRVIDRCKDDGFFVSFDWGSRRKLANPLVNGKTRTRTRKAYVDPKFAGAK